MAEVTQNKHHPDLPSDLDRLIDLRNLETKISDFSDLAQKHLIFGMASKRIQMTWGCNPISDGVVNIETGQGGTRTELL